MRARFNYAVAGDYNGDQVVDAADYVAWRKAAASNESVADGNDDCVVDIEDYNLWQIRFGVSSGVGSVANVLS